MSITFLFGSGADTDACSKLKSGQSFSEALLTGKYSAEVSSLLGDDFTSFRLVYHTSIKVFAQTIVCFPEEARSVLGDAIVDEFIKYDNDKKSVKSDEIREKCHKFYNMLSSDKNEDQEIKEFFCKYAVFFDSLDEKFNSLRYKPLNDNAKRVINAYTTVFVLMMKSLFNMEDFTWNFSNVFDKLREEYEIDKANYSYYRQLKESYIDCNVVTTNYTNLVEQETGADATYLHGRMTWFEDLADLTIYDCTDKTDREHLLNAERIIPFIFIPSGVKPLICTKQIKQFFDFISKLENSDELCVVGYRFNSEDNHINSIIAEWLRNDCHKLFYFNFNGDVNFRSFEWARHFSLNEFAFSEKGMKGLTSDNIQNIIVNKDNCRIAFSNYLKRVKAKKEG